jgi:hypothetical protein
MITNLQKFSQFIKESILPPADDTLTSAEPSGTNNGAASAIQMPDQKNIYQRYMELKKSGVLENELFPQLAQEFNISVEELPNLLVHPENLTEGFMDPVSPVRMQKKVDEVNALIAAAIDSEKDALDVIDSSSTWQAPMQFSPFIYKGGYLYSQYKEMGHKGWEVKKERYKPSDSYDAYQWLNTVAKWYRSAMKKNNIALPGQPAIDSRYVIFDHSSNDKQDNQDVDKRFYDNAIFNSKNAADDYRKNKIHPDYRNLYRVIAVKMLPTYLKQYGYSFNEINLDNLKIPQSYEY